jgi:putative transcriptional regulator
MFVSLPMLRLYRHHHLLSQTELAKRSGVSRQTIISIENGKQARVTTARKLAATMGVQISQLRDNTIQ